MPPLSGRIGSFAGVSLHLLPTSHTPEVLIEPDARRFLLRGTCFPEDSIAFCQPVRAFLQNHLPALRSGAVYLHAEITYINSSAQRELYRLLTELVEQGIELHITIYTGEDEEMDDLRHIVAGLQAMGVKQIVYQEGYYISPSVAEEASPGEG